MSNQVRGTKWLLIILTILTLISIALNLFNRNDNFETNFREAIANYIHNKPKDGKDGTDGINGYTPVKGVDYFDGRDGQDSASTHTKETVIEQVPVNGKDGADGEDGRTPVLRCNESKNRWELSYIGDKGWTVIKNENGEPSKCKPIIL